MFVTEKMYIAVVLQDLLELDVLFLDEVSMIDVDAWAAMSEMLSIADHSRHADGVDDNDPFGCISVICFGDFKQLFFPQDVTYCNCNC